MFAVRKPTSVVDNYSPYLTRDRLCAGFYTLLGDFSGAEPSTVLNIIIRAKSGDCLRAGPQSSFRQECGSDGCRPSVGTSSGLCADTSCVGTVITVGLSGGAAAGWHHTFLGSARWTCPESVTTHGITSPIISTNHNHGGQKDNQSKYMICTVNYLSGTLTHPGDGSVCFTVNNPVNCSTGGNHSF